MSDPGIQIPDESGGCRVRMWSPGGTIPPVAVIPMHDAEGGNAARLPAGQVAGYITGSGSVPWTAAQLSARPGTVRIDQSPVITAADVTADFFDQENGAVTLTEIARLVKAGQAAYKAAARPGQRNPGVYCSASGVTPVVNALVAGGVTSCPLGVADYSVSVAYATEAVAGASGPFPVVWYQYADDGGGGDWDLGVASLAWLNTVSGGPAGRPVLKTGSSGAAVILLQETLGALGWQLAADGLLGPATATALEAFQGGAGLAADGTCGLLTWTALGA
jgi:peptidoglycan hydrolase-like protein with peptidoglycan-binding domain